MVFGPVFARRLDFRYPFVIKTHPTMQPSPAPFSITLYRSLYDLDAHAQISEPWPSLVARFSKHQRVVRKDDSPGFGPYALNPPSTPCYDHRDGIPRGAPHRCDACVTQLSLAVFDVDIGIESDVLNTETLLSKAGVAYLLYSTYNHRPDKPSYRLVIPLASGVPAHAWGAFRTRALAHFAIPADPKKCSGVSHFYYLPSCPTYGTPVVRVGEGSQLKPESVAFIPPAPKAKVSSTPRVVWSEPDEPEGPIDLAPHIETLRDRAGRLARNNDPDMKRKGRWLSNALDGVALDEHGSRTIALLVTSGVMVAALPARTPRVVFERLLGPSLAEMQAAGSKLDAARLEGMLLPAMRRHDERAAEDEALMQAIERRAINTYNAIPTKGDK